MSNQTDFAARINRINKTAKKNDRVRRRNRPRNAGLAVIMPMMMASFVAGGVVLAWEIMERPTDNPLQYAGTLTAMVLSQ